MALDLSLLDGAAMGAAVITGGVAPQAPLAAFEEDPDNPRFEDEGPEFERFVADVARRGILQPVVVRRMPSGRLRLRFGRRRYRAACRLALPALSYVVCEDPRQFDDYAQVAENERRKPLQPLELATFIARKLAQGAKKKAVAAQLGIDASALTHLLVLVQAPPPLLLELYHSRRCRSPQYLYELRRLYQQDAVLVEQALAAATVLDRAWLMAVAAQLRPGAARATAAPSAPAPAAAQVLAPLPGGDSTAAPAPARLRMPLLQARYQGRALSVLLHRLPSAEGRVWVRFDGERDAVDVPIAALQLSALVEGRRLRAAS